MKSEENSNARWLSAVNRMARTCQTMYAEHHTNLIDLTQLLTSIEDGTRIPTKEALNALFVHISTWLDATYMCLETTEELKRMMVIMRDTPP